MLCVRCGSVLAAKIPCFHSPVAAVGCSRSDGALVQATLAPQVHTLTSFSKKPEPLFDCQDGSLMPLQCHCTSPALTGHLSLSAGYVNVSRKVIRHQ